MLSFGSFGVAINANKHSKKSNEIALCQELFRQKERIIEFVQKWERGDIERGAFNAALSNYLDVYELCCGSYLNNEICKKNFRRNFKEDIKRLVERTAYQEVLGNEATSYYVQIWKVYREFRGVEIS